MAIVNDLIDEFQQLANNRMPWDAHWRDIAAYVLPQIETYDGLLATNPAGAVSAVVDTPVSARKSKDLYDMTSLWGVDRLSAGLQSLKTPESQKFHELGTDSLFGEEQTREELVASERLNDYLFRVRGNPNSGFWNAHRPAIKSMCAFGTGWMFVEEKEGTDGRVPFTYQYMPIVELYPGVGPNGQSNRMFRLFAYTMEQAVKRFGKDNVPKTVLDKANNPTQRHTRVKVMHAVRPREESVRHRNIGVRGSAYQAWYCFPDDKELAGDESGFFEFPFIRYAWQNVGLSAFCEGPVSFCIGEIRSLQEMAKNELIAVQTMLRPAYGTVGKNMVRLNLNPGAVNPGLMTPDGKQLFAPLNTGVRPDFAQAVIEQRRNSIREMMYLNLWNILLDQREQTATEAMIRAQEKGDMLGPTGISLNEGLSHMVDREIGILNRKRAFDDGSPLAMPDSMTKKNIAPTFVSPLDRMRRMGEVVGMTRLLEFAGALEAIRPGTAIRLDVDEMLDVAQEVLGAPAASLRDKDEAADSRGQLDQMQSMMGQLAALKGAGEATKALGEGGQAVAQGAEATAQSPAAQTLLNNGPGVLQQALNTQAA